MLACCTSSLEMVQLLYEFYVKKGKSNSVSFSFIYSNYLVLICLEQLSCSSLFSKP